MTGNEILKADMLDILFDNRNKEYGAYKLRKYYPNRLILSLTIALSSVLLLFFLVGPGSSETITVKNNHMVDLQEVKIPVEKKKIEIEQPRLTIASKVAAAPQQKFVDKVAIVHDDKKIFDKMPLNNLLEDKIISDMNRIGTPGGAKVPVGIPSVGDGNSNKPATAASDAPLINREPEFPGGVKAWLDFLGRHLRVPSDLEPGEKKTVLIRFEVAVDGSVTGFQVMQSGGRYYDDEVIRVLKKMPKWKPALQSSQPVAVAFTQPVTFMGVEAD